MRLLFGNLRFILKLILNFGTIMDNYDKVPRMIYMRFFLYYNQKNQRRCQHGKDAKNFDL